MPHVLGILLLLLCTLPASAQSLLVDPTVWVSVSTGMFTWAPTDLNVGERDNVIHDFSVSVASPRWRVQSGAQISGYVNPLGGGRIPFSTREVVENEGSPVSYRTLYAIGGPWTTSRWFMAGAAVGPALTWGTRLRPEPSPCHDATYCTLQLTSKSELYLNLGLVGSVQGFVRLDGRLWIGGETMAVVNRSSSHLATRFAVRVDLLRPDR
jgi:hypothetical protein